MKTLHDAYQPGGHDPSMNQLEAAIASALLDGELKPGDRVAGPDELAHRLEIPLSQVLESISHMLSRRILRQDESGNLYIHSGAMLTVEMRQQAFVLRARQLIATARKWDLPSSSITPLLFRAAQQVA